MPSPETCGGLGMSQTRHLVSGEGLVNATLFFSHQFQKRVTLNSKKTTDIFSSTQRAQFFHRKI